tara:strand:- start:609 stop:890 length:282 start_codon:yes stop_codon:yes gene_type:complete
MKLGDIIGYVILIALAFQLWGFIMENLLWVLGILVIIGVIAAGFRGNAVAEHKKNLLKGGLIPKASSYVHQKALREIAAEKPNVQLPRRQYYD